MAVEPNEAIRTAQREPMGCHPTGIITSRPVEAYPSPVLKETCHG